MEASQIKVGYYLKYKSLKTKLIIEAYKKKMIKHSEIAMVNAASYALEYQDKNPRAEIEEIIQRVIQNLDTLRTEKNIKVFGIAAASEILKLKKENKHKTNKQILQMFVNNSKGFLDKINEGMDEE